MIDDIVRRHGEPHRRYHTANHVLSVLRHVDDLLSSEGDEIDHDAVVAAALFHDAVYDPASTTNEADSAALATAQLARLGWNPARCAHVRR